VSVKDVVLPWLTTTDVGLMLPPVVVTDVETVYLLSVKVAEMVWLAVTLVNVYGLIAVVTPSTSILAIE